MEKVRRYEFEGIVLDIPLQYDERSGIYIEIYPDFTERPIYTPDGNPVMFAGEDACPFAKEATPGGCPDCGSCKYYRRAAPHTWIGVCGNERNRNMKLNE